jgi:hypothetical protein
MHSHPLPATTAPTPTLARSPSNLQIRPHRALLAFLTLSLPPLAAAAETEEKAPEFKVTTVKEGSGEPLATIEELVTLELGRMLRYKQVVDGWEDDPFIYDMVLESIEEDGGVRMLQYSRAEVTPDAADDPLTSEGLMRLDDGLWSLWDRGEEGGVIFTPGLLEIPTDLRVGAEQAASHETLEFEGAEEFKSSAEICYQVMGFETVTTPAGKFEDCVKIRYEEKLQTEAREFVSTGEQWFKPGLGLVRVETKGEDEHTLVDLIAIDPE